MKKILCILAALFVFAITVSAAAGTAYNVSPLSSIGVDLYWMEGTPYVMATNNCGYFSSHENAVVYWIGNGSGGTLV